MKELKQKEIKRLIKTGAAVDITNWEGSKILELRKKGLEKIGLSFGIYGINGGLFKDIQGNLYGIPSRASNLFILV